MEAGGVANQPTEQAGMTPEVIQKLQDKATVLTQERKKRGKTVPEDLVSHDLIRTYHTLASHPVSLYEIMFWTYVHELELELIRVNNTNYVFTESDMQLLLVQFRTNENVPTRSKLS